MGWFGRDLPAEPHFVDESAYISQSFYGDLLIVGDRDSPAWLEYAGYDLPPLPKYLIDLGLRIGGFRRPGRDAPYAWYARSDRRFVSSEGLNAARKPSVLLGALGCLGIYAVGSMGFGRAAGMIAALMLMINPLYRMHARRAMSDVPAEAFLLLALAVGLWSWRRAVGRRQGFDGPGAAGLIVGSGVLIGLATLAKLNGVLAGLILGGWAALALIMPGCRGWRKAAIVATTLAAGVVAFGTFAALNPFLTAHPPGRIDPRLEPMARLGFWGRVRAVADHRVTVSQLALEQFPHNALPRLRDKVEAVAVQGYGRFGPLGPRDGTDSVIRFDWRQDRGAILWIPVVLAGLGVASARGLRQVRLGEPPTAWAVALGAGVSLAVVTLFIPLAWDRYYLSIQPGSALLASAAASGLWERIRRPAS